VEERWDGIGEGELLEDLLTRLAEGEADRREEMDLVFTKKASLYSDCRV
jgi:hypothetical protein